MKFSTHVNQSRSVLLTNQIRLFLMQIYWDQTILTYKHASLACAARLADTACPQSRPKLLNLTYLGNFFPLYKYCKQNLTNNFSYGSENIIFEIYTPENPMSTVGI